MMLQSTTKIDHINVPIDEKEGVEHGAPPGLVIEVGCLQHANNHSICSMKRYAESRPWSPAITMYLKYDNDSFSIDPGDDLESDNNGVPLDPGDDVWFYGVPGDNIDQLIAGRLPLEADEINARAREVESYFNNPLNFGYEDMIGSGAFSIAVRVKWTGQGAHGNSLLRGHEVMTSQRNYIMKLT